MTGSRGRLSRRPVGAAPDPGGSRPTVGELSGVLRRMWARLAASSDELEAAELQERVHDSGAVPLRECQDRQRVTVSGTLRTVALRPSAGSPSLEAELYDGSGTVTLIWLGRRRVAGIEPGRGIVATGRIAVRNGEATMYNPRYLLRPAERA